MDFMLCRTRERGSSFLLRQNGKLEFLSLCNWIGRIRLQQRFEIVAESFFHVLCERPLWNIYRSTWDFDVKNDTEKFSYSLICLDLACHTLITGAPKEYNSPLNLLVLSRHVLSQIHWLWLAAESEMLMRSTERLNRSPKKKQQQRLDIWDVFINV